MIYSLEMNKCVIYNTYDGSVQPCAVCDADNDSLIGEPGVQTHAKDHVEMAGWLKADG